MTDDPPFTYAEDEIARVRTHPRHARSDMRDAFVLAQFAGREPGSGRQ